MNRDRREPAYEEAPSPPDGAEHRLRYQELFELAPDGQLMTDSSGIILEANHAAVTLLRRSRDSLIGEPLGLVLRGDRRRFDRSLQRLAAGAGADEFASSVASKGEVRDVRVQGFTMPGASPNLALRWHVCDATEAALAERARRDLSRRLTAAEENERRRLARELHDRMGQELTGLTLGLKLVEGLLPADSEARSRVQDLLGIVGRLGRMAHDIAVELRPTALDDLGLGAALEYLAGRWSRRTGIPVDVFIDNASVGRGPADAETAAYRIVQECFTNVAKHAGASRVSLIVGRRHGHLVTIVEDDGRGVDPAAEPASGRLGLIGMRERVQLLGGTLHVESGSGAGMTVRARIPFEDHPPGEHDG
jgi:PAS domain S-box-containing protein